jgi:hypothetical protein
MQDILQVIKNIQSLYENNTSLAVLKDFERVLDEMDLYVYKNWEDGELAYGPKVGRHWITAGFMWPIKNMPDPAGGKRLLDVGCKITYQRSYLLQPRKIASIDDIRPGTKKGKLDKLPIWIVEITMPKQLAFDVYRGYMDNIKSDSERTLKTPKMASMPAAAAPLPPPGGMPPGGATGLTGAPTGMPSAAPTTPPTV